MEIKKYFSQKICLLRTTFENNHSDNNPVNIINNYENSHLTLINNNLKDSRKTILNNENILDLKSSEEFREWMIKNHSSQRECWVNCKRGKADKDELSYVDAVYVALSFGWIDSTYGLIDGKRMQRFSPRRKNSNWSQLNKERCRWLIRNGLMTDSGYESLPDLEEDFIIDSDILDELKKDGETWNNFKNFPDLYKRIRIANIQKEKDREAFDKKLANFIKDTKDNKMKGNWNDDGRLI